MARQDVYRKYDENGNVVDEVRFDEGTPEYNAAIEARNGSGGEVNGYYINRGTGHITSPVGAEAMSSISQLAEEMSPKIKVNDKGTGLVVSGSKEAVTSEMGTQLKKYLDDTFKYADLRSENVADAINKLNESLADQVEQRVVEGMLDVPYDDYKEYKLAMQQFQGTNPLTSTGAIPGYDRQGRKIKATDNDKKTVNDWLEYYMKNYTATERAELFAKSLAAIQSGDRDFAKWTPYLVMSGGGYSSAPIYGFSDAEKAGTLVQNAVYNAFGKLTESAANAAQFISNPFAWWGFARKNGVNDVAHALGHGEDVSLSEAKWMTEEAFNKKLDSIIGKNVNELTSDEQAFLAVALGDSGVGAKGPFGIGSWYDVKNFITEEGNDNISREQIEKATSYQDYINARDNLSTISKYSKELSENAENLAGTKDIKRDIEAAQIYAPVQSGIGSFAGTMIRFWIENGLVSGLTGGDFAPASLSDSYAESIMNVLQKVGLKRAPEALSKGLPNFLLRVVAEVPEDIVQTAIDDALTGRADEIGTLFTPDSIAENTLQNLVMRLAFTPVHAGYQWAKTKLAIQRAAKEAGMEAKAPDSLFDNSRKVQQAADGVPGAGTIVDATANSVTIRRDDGSTEVLDNVAILRPFTSPEGKEKYPREYEILRKKGLVADVADSDLSVRIEDARKAIENGEYNDVSVSIVPKTEADLDAMSAAKELKYQNREIVTYRGQPYNAEGDFVYNEPDLRKRLAESPVEPQSPDYGYGDAYFFTEYKPWAYEFGDSLVEFSFKAKDTLEFEDYYRLRQEANALAADANAMAEYAKKYGEENAELMQRIADNSFRAAAEFTGKPIIMATEGMRGPEWLYYKGVNEDFDKSAVAKLLYSSNPEYEEATRANIEMANRIQQSLDTEPYGRTIGEIVADKYKKGADTISDAPSSASYKWESPDVTKTYNSEAEVFADRPTGGNLTDVRQWITNGTNFYMTRFREQAVPAFNDSYKTVDAQHQFVRNMDYLFNLQRKGGEKLVVKKTPKAEAQPESGTAEFANADVDTQILNRVNKIADNNQKIDKIEKLYDEAKEIQKSAYDKLHADKSYKNGDPYPEWFTEEQAKQTAKLREAEDLATEIGIPPSNLGYASGGTGTRRQVELINKKLTDEIKQLKEAKGNNVEIGEAQPEPGTAEVDSANYRTGIVRSDTPFAEPTNEGFYKFTAENINRPSRDTGSIGIEQTLVTPGGPIDTLNAAIRSGEVEVKNGKIDERALRQAIEESYDEEIFVKNFYNDPDASYSIDTLTDIADQLGVKYANKDSLSKAVKDFVVNEAMEKFYEGNTTAKNNIILYRVISSDGNEVATQIIDGEKPKQGNIDWLKEESGDYVDNGVGFVTMDPDAVLGNDKLAGSGDRYILRMHIAEGTPMFSFGNRVLTGGSDILLGDTFRISRGDRAGGEFALAPARGKFINSGEVDANGNQIVDVYIGQEPLATAEPGDYEISGSVIGKTYENEGITYTVNEDDVRFYLDNIEPLMQGLREAGAAGVGQEAFTITGYLPHSDYDPTDLTAEDSMQQGVLWREYSGASTTSEDGNFSTGWLTPDLEERYRIFTKNMLWDSLGDEVVISKFMEELHEDGLDVDVQKVVNLVGGRKNLAKIVEKSDSAKKMVKHLVSNGELPSDGDIETNASAASMAEKIHTIYNPVYGSAEGLTQKGSVSLLTKSDWMRSLSTSDGSLYDNGGAMIVNSLADAKFLTKQIFDAIDNNQTIDVHKLFTDYISQNHRRTAKGASYIADKWMSKIAQQARNGGVTRREVTATLGNLIYGEGANRVFRFIGRMDTSKLNASNKQALDSLLFRHSMLSKIKNTSGLSANLNKLTNGLISARMKSLFWLNYKNGVLQASECIRLFTEFKLGDAIATIKRLATDKEFRELVDEWVDMLVPERFVKSDSEASVGALGTIVDNAKYSDGTLTINKLSPDAIKKLGKDFDKFANHPVEMGETLKNRILMAGILQEAERKGLSGNEQFSYVNQRFERIGLAANEMGRLNASDSPLFRIGANLKTFQIRQLRMFINNIQDANGKKEAVTYIIKTMGWKLGLATILTKLGYSASSVLGLDPFDLMDDDYTGVDEENYTVLDYAMLSPVAKLFLSGGFTSYIGDLYWAGRKAYEDSATVTEQTEKRVSRDFFPGWAAPGATFDNALNAFSGFIPGYTAGKRVYQMADLMSTGWATSSTGNKMYQAPDNPFDTATGYIFGRSNTPNARAYYQTPDYLHGIATGGLAGLGQQISREFSTLRAMFGDTNAGFRQFDPTDSQNYSDWFDGTTADEQQWNSGYYYFRNRVDQIQKDYQEALGKAYSDEDKNSLDESFNRQIGEIEDQLSRFTAAYEAKHPGGIDARKMRNLTTILNLYQPVMSDTAEERRQRELDANSEALYRYAQAGLPAVTSYSRNKDTGEVEPLYSPQLRSALQGEYGLPKEAAIQIRQLYNDKWKDLGQRYRDMLFATKGTKNKQAIQREYINIVRQDLDPIVRLYGNNIWSNEDVENIIDDVFNSMVPKYGQSVKSYLKELYKGYSGEIRYNESGNQVIAQIDGLLNQGRTAQAKALARTLLQRVQENRTSLTREELEKLQRILND